MTKKDNLTMNIIDALILCAEQGLAQRSWKDTSHDDDDDMKKVHQNNFLVIISTAAKFDTISKDQCIYNCKVKMLSWNR